MLNTAHTQAEHYITQYQSSFVFFQQLLPLLSYSFTIIFIHKTGYNFTVLILAGLTLLSGVAGAIFEGGKKASTWEIVLEDQFARFAMKGISIFMVFWGLNYSKFGGKNGVLGLVYLSGVFCVMGFAEWAWNKWGENFENWWLKKIGGKNTQWDTTVCTLICFVGWLTALVAQRIIRKN